MYNNKKEYTVKKGNERTKMHVSKKKSRIQNFKIVSNFILKSWYCSQ